MKNTLRIVQGKDPESIGSEVSAFGRALVANKFIMTVGTIGVGVFFMALVYYYFLGIGVEQNYEPEQPIAFSHAVHAGENKVIATIATPPRATARTPTYRAPMCV
jgi:uncharacterized membrane protein